MIRESEVITSEEIKIGNVSYQQIPQLMELGRKLLNAAGICLPKALPSRNVNPLNSNVVLTCVCPVSREICF